MGTKPPDNGDVAEALPSSSRPESQSVRTLPPWRYEPVRAPAGRRAGALGEFTRMFALEPARLGSLPAWWREQERDGYVEIGSRLLIGEPRAELLGVWRIGGSLRSPRGRRLIPVELWLWPHLDAWTMLELEPKRDVHPSRRYFSRGQRVLDVLCNRLIRELDVPAYC
jgi:hypothetical protein